MRRGADLDPSTSRFMKMSAVFSQPLVVPVMIPPSMSSTICRVRGLSPDGGSAIDRYIKAR
ncbi:MULTISPECIES: hypothetical protein [Bradyrhizobium]|uniref:Uncharacterized protein n=1 Tax=Bradyrhizobium vignae TaxID=1549949 RepID=A0ABS4A6G6_9BRAD|nr:hypothetical protein [Bradyrhizobium vignae]MBP0116007.1 hypothetical protein [Bradyrhizobium vignae]RXH02808.1 hypothetical protein EAV90_15340 [Bradyrhizobium vignae]